MKKVQERYQARGYSPRAALAAIGLKVNSLKLLDPVKQADQRLLRLSLQSLIGAFFHL